MPIQTTNQKRLRDSNIKLCDKLQITAYLKKESILKLDNLVTLTNAKSRNEILETAIDFYFGFETSQMSQEYLCATLGIKMEGIVDTLGNRISRMLFKSAVELDMQTRLLANVVNISICNYNKLRKTSIDAVKHTNGCIDIYHASQNSIEREE